MKAIDGRAPITVTSTKTVTHVSGDKESDRIHYLKRWNQVLQKINTLNKILFFFPKVGHTTLFNIVHETQKIQDRINITIPKFFLELNLEWIFLDVSHELHSSTTHAITPNPR